MLYGTAGRIVRFDGYHMIKEHRTRDRHQNADSLSKKTEFNERLEERQASQAEIKDGFSFLDKETYDELPLTRWLDKSGHPIPGHPELPVEVAATYPTLQQDLNRIRHISQNQNTVKVNRQIIHPTRNRSFQTPRVTFSIPQSPTPSSSEISSITLPDTPTLTSQQSAPNIPSGYLGSTPTSKQIRENPFN